MTEPTFQVSGVRPDILPQVWPEISEIVEKGIKASGGSLTPESLYLSIESGEMELWAVHDGPEIVSIAVLKIGKRPTGLVLVVVLVAGRDFHLWGQQIQDLIRDYAELIGANSIEAVARPGMAKWLKAMGWKRKAIVMGLNDG